MIFTDFSYKIILYTYSYILDSHLHAAESDANANAILKIKLLTSINCSYTDAAVQLTPSVEQTPFYSVSVVILFHYNIWACATTVTVIQSYNTHNYYV